MLRVSQVFVAGCWVGIKAKLPTFDIWQNSCGSLDSTEVNFACVDTAIEHHSCSDYQKLDGPVWFMECLQKNADDMMNLLIKMSSTQV